MELFGWKIKIAIAPKIQSFAGDGRTVTILSTVPCNFPINLILSTFFHYTRFRNIIFFVFITPFLYQYENMQTNCYILILQWRRVLFCDQYIINFIQYLKYSCEINIIPSKLFASGEFLIKFQYFHYKIIKQHFNDAWYKI